MNRAANDNASYNPAVDMVPLAGTAADAGDLRERVALAAALIRPVDLLMLDEPTNHIDAETIALLEGRLAASLSRRRVLHPLQLAAQDGASLSRRRGGNQRRRIVSARRKLFVLS